MKNKHMPKTKEIIPHSEEIEARTKAKPDIMRETTPKQPTATELLQQSYNKLMKLRQKEKAEKIARFKPSMFQLLFICILNLININTGYVQEQTRIQNNATGQQNYDVDDTFGLLGVKNYGRYEMRMESGE